MNTSKEGLLGKAVLSKEGNLIGKISGFLLEDETKKTYTIKVKPARGEKWNNDEYNYPSSSFIPVKDVVILEQDIKIKRD
jgi:sporulation protein YlmC with PRC-barrel domain